MLTETHPYSDAICAGIWVCSGSRDEPLAQKGMAHLLEHLVFKGTKNRTAFQLAKVMESRGGDLNAYTSRENICFYATSLGKDLELNLDVLTDLAIRATIPEKEFDNEKDVILQEIAMYYDHYEEYIFDAFSEDVYRFHAMGWPILGNEGTVRSITRRQVLDYYKETFAPQNLIVSIVGKVDHAKVVDYVQKNLGHLRKTRKKFKRTKPKFHKVERHIVRDIEQCHILVGFDSPGLTNPLRFASYIVNTALGGGVTSMLYQDIREKRGLAYTVYSTISNAADSGMTLIYAGADIENKKEVIDIILKDLATLKREGINKSTLARYKTQIKGHLILNDDDLESRMNSLCLNEQLFGGYRSLSDIITAIDNVQVSDIRKFLNKYVDLSKVSIMTLGPKEEKTATVIVDSKIAASSAVKKKRTIKKQAKK